MKTRRLQKGLLALGLLGACMSFAQADSVVAQPIEPPIKAYTFDVVCQAYVQVAVTNVPSGWTSQPGSNMPQTGLVQVKQLASQWRITCHYGYSLIGGGASYVSLGKTVQAKTCSRVAANRARCTK